MAGREADSQQETKSRKKSQSKADRQAAGKQQQVNRQQSGKTGMQAGSWLACGRQAEGKQAFRSTRSRKASMKQ